jgi:hypothetical protein
VWISVLVRVVYYFLPLLPFVSFFLSSFREIEWAGMDWIHPAQDRDQWRDLVNTVMNLLVSYNAEKFLSGCTIRGFSRRAQLHGVT